MRPFLLKLGLFVLPVLLVCFMFEWGLSGIPNSYSQKRTDFESQLDSIEVLILGNSRSLFGVNPDFFEQKGYNLSNISQTIYYNKELGIRYFPKMPKLTCVLIEVSKQSFGVQLCDGIEAWRDYFYSQCWGIRYPENKWYNIKHYSRFFLYEPKKSLAYAAKGFRVNLAKNLRRNGWDFKDTIRNSVNISDSLGKIRAEFNNNNYKEKRFAENVDDLDKLVAASIKRSIHCIIISSPVLPFYSKYMNTSKTAKGEAAIRYICKKYGIEYVDYTDDPRFVVRDYADNDHFNFIGAEKYSKILNEEILTRYKNLPSSKKPTIH